MIRFRALALGADGRADWSFVEAKSIEDAAAQLVANGFVPLDIRTGTPSLIERLNQPVVLAARIRGGELALVTEQLAALLEAGLPLERTLDMVAAQSATRGGRQLLNALLADIRGGATFGDALARQKSIPAYYVGVVRSAERGGRLRGGLHDLALTLRQTETVRQQLLSALTYPAIVLATTVLALLVVLVGVIPEFEPVFEGEEHRLPLLTQGVVGLSRLVTNDWPLLLLFMAALGLGGWLTLRHPLVKPRVARLMTGFPGSDLVRKYTAARMLRVLGSMLTNGVPLTEALGLTAGSVKAFGYAELARNAEQQVREGASLSAALGREPKFPATALRLIEVGEQSGELAAMSLRAAHLLEIETKARIERLVAIANPVAVVLLGGIVALLIMGVMLGIFSLNDLAL